MSSHRWFSGATFTEQEEAELEKRTQPVVPERVEHLIAPETPTTVGYNVYCPTKEEFTYIGESMSTDGMAIDVCHACREPEPLLKDVTGAELDDIFDRLTPTR